MAKVLVVDDDQCIVEFVREMLEAAGYSVITAADGCEALSVVEREQPDAVVTDLMMPRVDGESLCTRLKQNPRTRSIAVMLMSASSRLDRCRRVCPADGFLQKPFEPNEVLELVTAQLSRQRDALA